MLQNEQPIKDAARDSGRWLFRWNETLAVSTQSEFVTSQRHQTRDSKSPGAAGTQASCHSWKKQDHVYFDDEIPGKHQESTRLDQHCRGEWPAAQDVCFCSQPPDLPPLNAAATPQDPPVPDPGVEAATPRAPMPHARPVPMRRARLVPVVAPRRSPVPQKAAPATSTVSSVSSDLPPGLKASCSLPVPPRPVSRLLPAPTTPLFLPSLLLGFVFAPIVFSVPVPFPVSPFVSVPVPMSASVLVPPSFRSCPSVPGLSLLFLQFLCLFPPLLLVLVLFGLLLL
ncbi:hypothetical protein P4O66_020059, partial [Electrophorus voltai]